MHEGDADVAAYKKWLDECFEKEPIFILDIGQACRIRDEYVEHLPKAIQNNGFNFNDRFKLMYKRISETDYQWLDNEGNQGVDHGPLEFYEKHWEKV